MKKVIGVVQARWASRRLPGKALARLGPCTALEWIFRRLKKAKTLSQVVFSTGSGPENRALCRLAERHGISAFSGPEADLVKRFLGALFLTDADAMVRVTGDCPWVDPDLVDKMVGIWQKNPRVDFVTNYTPPTYPDGLDLDLTTRPALERMHRTVSTPLDREWFNAYILKHPGEFVIKHFSSPRDLSALRWTLDFPEDLAFFRRAFSLFGGRSLESMRTARLVALLERNPALIGINASRRDTTVQNGLRSESYFSLLKNRRAR